MIVATIITHSSVFLVIVNSPYWETRRTYFLLLDKMSVSSGTRCIATFSFNRRTDIEVPDKVYQKYQEHNTTDNKEIISIIRGNLAVAVKN